MRQLATVLIVEDDPSLRTTLERALSDRFKEVRSVSTVRDAEAALESPPDLVLLDMVLPDGSGLDVMARVRELEISPLVIGMSGAAEPDQSFALAQLGARAYLPKPLDLETLEPVIERIAASEPDLVPHIRASVGHRPIHEVEEQVRVTMLREALARSRGNRRGAARLLSISRQLVQHMLRRMGLE